MSHEVHVPQYSWAPLIIGIGVFFVNAGFVFGVGVGVFGLLVVAGGIVTWIREDMTYYERGNESGEHH